MSTDYVDCPVCGKHIEQTRINAHLDRNCLDAEQPEWPGQLGRKRPSADCLTGEKATAHEGQLRSSHDPLPTSDDHISAAKRPKHSKGQHAVPLAERARTRDLDGFFGHEEIVGQDGILRKMMAADTVPSMILWGPPGSGKTTLARIMARKSKSRYKEFSSTSHGVSDFRRIFEEASSALSLSGTRTIVFLDEIHRYSKNQQDIFLPHVENGTIVLIGATTENPSFKINSALLSRCQVVVLNKLTDESIYKILDRTNDSLAEEDSPLASKQILTFLSQLADGDARMGLNMLEVVINLAKVEKRILSIDDVKPVLMRTHIVYDRKGDAHYDTISAFIKSMRSSDPDAAIYYLARMLIGGEDPLFITRRMIIFASEDIGLADPSMLPFAVATHTSVQQVGLPEAEIMISHCAIQLALSAKSRASYEAFAKVKRHLKSVPGSASAPIPMHLRNAPTKLMKELGYGKRPEDGRVERPNYPTNDFFAFGQEQNST